MSASQVTSNLAECFGDELRDLNQSVWDMFHSTAKKYPLRDAIVSMWQPKEHLQNLIAEKPPQGLEETKCDGSGNVMRWSYADLLIATERVAGWLQSQGCAQGQRLVVFLWNSTEWVLFFWVAARMRMTYIPLDPRSMEKSADEYMGLLQPSVLVAQNEEAAIILETSCSRLKDVRIRISCNKVPSVSWTSLPALSPSQPAAQPFQNGDLPGQELSLIIFTSGTTSVPKGCPHTATNLWSETHDWDPETNLSLVEKWLVHTPVSHVFAVNNSLRAWRNGASVVFASKSFDINTSLNALETHQCTHMSAIPTLVQALLSHPKFPGKESLALRYVSLGGTLIKEEDVQLCRRLGSDTVIQAYGMSEGAPTTSWIRNDPLLVSGHYPGVGKVLPGCMLRICALGSRTPLGRNVAGELHMGGTSVITGYLNDTDPDSFYTDKYGRWLKTGDQALIDNNNVLQILGRYKDLIIRGGENISPAKIESHLGQIPGLFVSTLQNPRASKANHCLDTSSWHTG
jgi:acyl-CoA synthetase (AMP-forming)/AMP-acid ligase II